MVHNACLCLSKGSNWLFWRLRAPTPLRAHRNAHRGSQQSGPSVTYFSSLVRKRGDVTGRPHQRAFLYSPLRYQCPAGCLNNKAKVFGSLFYESVSVAGVSLHRKQETPPGSLKPVRLTETGLLSWLNLEHPNVHLNGLTAPKATETTSGHWD